MGETTSIQIPPGMICVTTYGSVRPETAYSLLEMRGRAEKQGAHNISWHFIHAPLVDKARNDAVRALLDAPTKPEWLWFIDADMQFPPQLLDVMVFAAFRDATWADIVGGYCQLRGTPYLPTIDTGTGTWEPTLPNSGIVEVMRTGGACLIIRRPVFERMQYPWFGVRSAPSGLDALTNFDNFARIKFDGRNPFAALKEWDLLFKCAKDEAPGVTNKPISSVGEDSNFCDRAHALGFRIAVQTNAVVGHVDTHIILPPDHIEAVNRMHDDEAAAAGVLG